MTPAVQDAARKLAASCGSHDSYARCLQVGKVGRNIILATVVRVVYLVGVVAVPAYLHIDLWCALLHLVPETWPFLLYTPTLWPRFKQRKQRWTDLNSSRRSLTSVTFLHSWAQRPLDSQNTQSASTVYLCFRTDLGRLEFADGK
jgi:hypothetical protein